MKKIFISLLILTGIILPASAEFRWGPSAGVDVSSFFWKQDLVETHHRFGFNAGLLGELMIPGIGFGVDLGLRYNQHGADVNFGERPIWAADGLGNEPVTIHAIQIPLSLKFKWTRMDGLEQYVAPFAYAGPVFSFTVATNNCPAIEHPMGTVGIQVGAGAEFLEHWQLSGGYCWGVAYEIRTIKLDNFSARSQGWHINLAYLF